MSDADRWLVANPVLARAMTASPAFRRVRDDAAIDVDGERLYIVRGDTLGSEADLFVETLVRGATAADPGDPARALWLELDDEARALATERITEGSGEGGTT